MNYTTIGLYVHVHVLSLMKPHLLRNLRTLINGDTAEHGTLQPLGEHVSQGAIANPACS